MNGAESVDDVNIASALVATAARIPEAIAVMRPLGRKGGAQRYAEIRYRELDEDSARIARGLRSIGLAQGTRVALMVPPGPDFFGLAFGLFRAGVVPILIDPGIGLSALKTCLAEAAPEAFIGVPKAHLARIALGWARSTVRQVITVGRSLGWGGFSLENIRARGEREPSALPRVAPNDLAAIIFTSGSTGIPKGVCYTHANFAAQVALIRAAYDIRPGEIDLPTFPLFALFDPALGMTTVIPEMDFTRPANVDPREILDPIQRFQITNMFGSPALLNRVGRWSEGKSIRLPSLRRVISAGASVPAAVQARFAAMLGPDARIHTPYGATEALPVASIDHTQILSETRLSTDAGQGVCVGQPMVGVGVEILRITDAPMASWSDDLRAAPGEFGEIAVSGAHVTARYFGRDESTRLAKIPTAGGAVFHRMGDIGRLDEQGRIWFAGRKSHRVEIDGHETLFTECVEAVFNTHPDVFRTALVGVRRQEQTRPVLCVELEAGRHRDRDSLVSELKEIGNRYSHTKKVQTFLVHPKFPVDIRHNSKIFREKLARWAEDELPRNA